MTASADRAIEVLLESAKNSAAVAAALKKGKFDASAKAALDSSELLEFIAEWMESMKGMADRGPTHRLILDSFIDSFME